jgi:putative transcriptional regulator
MMATNNLNLTGHFLIAMPNLDDPFFAKSVTFICTHNADGAMGIMINQPTDMPLSELYGEINLPLTNQSISNPLVLFGGPVQPDRGFILHPTPDEASKEWDSCIHVTEQIGVTSSKDILEAIGASKGPEQFLFSLGYAGWSPGQLENEILQNAWLSVAPPDHQTLHTILYETAHDAMFDVALKLLGINPMMLSGVAGHA